MPETWTLNDCTLILGDCLEVLPTLTVKVDAVVTDPPYGMTCNQWDSCPDLAAMWRAIGSASGDVCAVVCTASQPFTSALVASNVRQFRHEWIWIKNRGSNFANTVREPFKEHESVLVFAARKWKYRPIMQERTGGGASRVRYPINQFSDSSNYRKMRQEVVVRGSERVPSSWQRFNTEVGSHPTQKPVALMEYMVKTYSDAGDTILDPFMGSGTTGVACIKTGRNFIGIEKEPKYFEIAKRRIAEAYEATALLEGAS